MLSLYSVVSDILLGKQQIGRWAQAAKSEQYEHNDDDEQHQAEYDSTYSDGPLAEAVAVLLAVGLVTK